MNPWELLRVSTFEAAASKARLALHLARAAFSATPTGQEGAHPSEASRGSSSGGSVATVLTLGTAPLTLVRVRPDRATQHGPWLASPSAKEAHERPMLHRLRARRWAELLSSTPSAGYGRAERLSEYRERLCLTASARRGRAQRFLEFARTLCENAGPLRIFAGPLRAFAERLSQMLTTPRPLVLTRLRRGRRRTVGRGRTVPNAQRLHEGD